MISGRLRIAVATAYVVFIVGVVIVASLGGTEEVFGFLTRWPYGDKLGHFVLIGTLAAVIDFATGWKTWHPARVPIPVGPLVVVFVVLAEEFSQHFLSTRTFSWTDLTADALGVAVFVLLTRALAARTRTLNR